MAGNIKLSTETLKPFCGEGYITAWFSKIKLMARLRDITNIACLIPLYLESDALVSYLEIMKEKQGDAHMIDLILKEAFTGPYVAYGILSRARRQEVSRFYGCLIASSNDSLAKLNGEKCNRDWWEFYQQMNL